MSANKICEIWLDPSLEKIREYNRCKGYSFIVSVGGKEFEFDCLKDVWEFEPVRGKVGESFNDFAEAVRAGEVWSAEGVDVWLRMTFGRDKIVLRED